MNKDYIIFTDVSIDIDPDFAKNNDIRFIPMYYTLGGEERTCTRIEDEAILKAFYDGQRNGDLTRTSQITPQQYIDIFEPILKDGMDILYISLSSGLTKTFDSVCMANKELSEMYPNAKLVPVDSLAATGGMGLLVEAAVQNKANGISIDENAKWLEAHRDKLCLWFMVEDLMYLKRGGRISGTTAVIGKTLNIKPILNIDHEGKLATIDKKRGTKTAIKELVNKYTTSKDEKLGDRIYIVHADCIENADLLEEKLKEVNPNANITKMMLSPIIGAHTGPGMLAVIHFGTK